MVNYCADYLPAVFLLDAGDATQGTFFVNDNQGAAAIEIMNAIGYDAMAVGNHEFDFGLDNALRLQEMAHFPFLSQVDGFKPYTMIERGGVKLGVFGITTMNTKRSSNGGFDVDFGTVESQIEYSKNCVAALKAEGAAFIVALTHLGIAETGEGTSCDIRDNVDGIDVIIDGHSHTRLADIEQSTDKTPIVSTGEYANTIGILEMKDGVMKFDTYPRSYFRGLTAVASVSEVIGKWQEAADLSGKAVIGHSNVAAEYDREMMRTQETALGDLVADSVRAVAGADVAFVNGGNIRASLEVGDITIENVYSVLPYINSVTTAKVKGSVLKEALEVSISELPGAAGGFLQISGMVFEFDKGGVTKVTVGGAELDENAEYTLATNDWLASGGDGFTMLVEPFLQTVPNKETEISTMTDALVWYLENLSDDYVPKIDGRIIQK